MSKYLFLVSLYNNIHEKVSITQIMHSYDLKHAKISRLPYNYIYPARSCHLFKENSNLLRFNPNQARSCSLAKIKCLVLTRTEEITPLSGYRPNLESRNLHWLVRTCLCRSISFHTILHSVLTPFLQQDTRVNELFTQYQARPTRIPYPWQLYMGFCDLHKVSPL